MGFKTDEESPSFPWTSRIVRDFRYNLDPEMEKLLLREVAHMILIHAMNEGGTKTSNSVSDNHN